MKAEELFVGALVRVNRDGLCIKKDTIVEVRAVDADDKLKEKGLIGSAHCRPLDDNQFEGGIWCEYLDPIPLTPEILEKNGFRHGCYVGGYYSPDCPFRVFTKTEGTCGFTTLFDDEIHFSCIFVHQLQNALFLCGIEKEITI